MSDKPRDADANVVRSMLDRPVAEVARFAGRVATTWLRGLVDPWRLGAAAASGSGKLAPPFAFLVVMLFLTVLARRFLVIMNLAWHSDTKQTAADLREQLQLATANLDLTRVILITLPGVLLVTLCVRLLSIATRCREPLDADRLVAAACYALGWVSGAVALIAAGLWALLVSDACPPGGITRLSNDLLPPLLIASLAWTAMIFAPALRERFPVGFRWRTPLALLGASVAIIPLTIGGFWALDQTAKIPQTDSLRENVQRFYDRYAGELEVNVLGYEGDPGGDRARLTVALTSRAERVIVVPSRRSFGPPHFAHEKYADGALRILGSSLDDLPDRALVIEPDQTRVAVFEVEPDDLASGRDQSYAIPYHRRHVDGSFTASEAFFWRSSFTRDHLKAGRMYDDIVR